MRKTTNKEELKEMILEIADIEYRFLSIREITNQIENRFGIKKSPQIIKRLLRELEKEEKLQRE